MGDAAAGGVLSSFDASIYDNHLTNQNKNGQAKNNPNHNSALGGSHRVDYMGSISQKLATSQSVSAVVGVAPAPPRMKNLKQTTSFN